MSFDVKNPEQKQEVAEVGVGVDVDRPKFLEFLNEMKE